MPDCGSKMGHFGIVGMGIAMGTWHETCLQGGRIPVNAFGETSSISALLRRASLRKVFTGL